MGWLIRFILFSLVITWVFRGISRFLSGSAFGQAQQQQRNFNGGNGKQRPSDGNVNIDYAPKQNSTKKSSENFKGGDYVDYEEVK